MSDINDKASVDLFVNGRQAAQEIESSEAHNQLAQEARRVGKTSQEDVLGFVGATKQINIALL